MLFRSLHEAPPEEQNFAMIMEMLGSAPVSYTHLDVYKRQVYIMTKDYMQNFNPPGRSYLTGILKGCRQNQIPTEPIMKAARKPPVPGKTQKSQPKKQRKAGQER